MFEEMKGRIKEDDSSVPAPDGAVGLLRPLRDRAPSTRSMRAARAAGADGEQVLLDDDALAKGKAYFRGRRRRPQPRPRPVRLGRRRAGLGVLPRSTSRTWRPARCSAEPIESAYGDFTFSPDSQWIFWIWRDDNGRPAKVFRRPGARRRRRAGLRGSRRRHVPQRRRAPPTTAYILIHVGNQETTESLADPGRRSRPPRRSVPSRATSGVLYEPRPLERPLGDPHQRRRRGRLQAGRGSDARRPGQGELDATGSPTSPAASSPASRPSQDHLVRAERVNAIRPDRGHRPATAPSTTIGFDEEAYALVLEGGYEYDTTDHALRLPVADHAPA